MAGFRVVGLGLRVEGLGIGVVVEPCHRRGWHAGNKDETLSGRTGKAGQLRRPRRRRMLGDREDTCAGCSGTVKTRVRVISIHREYTHTHEVAFIPR